MKTRILIFVLLVLGVISCKNQENATQTTAVIKTDLGDIKIKLYNETPKHRDNFIKLVKEGFYKDILFHRVVKGILIQGGDPTSRHAPMNIPLGGGGPGYSIPSEIIFPKLYHKRGAIAAARQPDRVNPQKESSGSQFYIVLGSLYDSTALAEIAVRRNDVERGKVFNRIVPQFRDSMNYLLYSQMPEKLKRLQDSVMALTDQEFLKSHNIFSFNHEQIQTYSTIGGMPFLDGEYTVFGEVTEGMAVVDSISKLNANEIARPLEDIVFKIKILNE